MRSIGEIQGEQSARTFGDYLYAQGIAHELEAGTAADQWIIWIKSDDDLARAGDYLELFRREPAHETFRDCASGAAARKRQEGEDAAAYRRRVRSSRGIFVKLSGHSFGVVSYVLILACVVVFVLTRYGADFEPVDSLWISKHRSFAPLLKRAIDLREVRSGEIWRLLTPVFIHMNILHILFNMMWLATLGSTIEARQSRALLLRLVIVLGIGSNLVQFIATGRPSFGGMSGVVYGLLGYMWIRGKLDPSSGLRLDSYTLITSIIWFFFCFTDWVGPIANGAHAGGLGLGMVWGWLASRRTSLRSS